MSVIQTLSEGLSRLLREDDDAPSAAAPRPPPADPAMSTPSFEQRLAALVRHSGKLLAGRLNFISFESIKAEAGPRWPEIRERVFEATAAIVRRHAGPHDLFAASGDAQFLILFADLKPAEAQLLCQLIARKVVERFLGEDGVATIAVSTVVAEVDGHLLLNAVNPTTLLHAALDEAAAPLPARRSELPAGLVFAYRPIWDTKRDAITTLVCDPEADLPAWGRRHGYAVLGGDPTLGAIAELDLEAATRVVDDLAALLNLGGRMLLCLAVHFQTIEHAESRRRLAELFEAAPERVRAMILIEVVGLPPLLSESRVQRLVGMTRPFCRAVTLRLDLHDTNAERLCYSGVASLCVHLGERAFANDAIQKPLAAFAAEAAVNGFRAIAHGIGTRGLVHVAANAGFRYVDVKAFNGTADKPVGMQRFQLPGNDA